MTAILTKIEQARKELLDLSGRNHLTNYHRTSKNKSSGIPIFDELPDQIYRILVTEGQSMTFLSLAEEEVAPALPLITPFDEQRKNKSETAKLPERYTDYRLQTSLALKDLEPRLRRIYNTARTFVEEQGINALYLALGMLQWFEAEDSQEMREAPLILIPVELYRDNVRTRFKLRYTGDDIGSNLSLQEKLLRDFSIQLPIGPENDSFEVKTYLDAISQVIASRPRWSVDSSAIVLNFFRFNKLLMYKDLEPSSWSNAMKLANHPVLEALLGGNNFLSQTVSNNSLSHDGDSSLEDTHLNKSRLVVDADSSQVQAIQATSRGHSLVIQGPPGTGKSQTITNIIAEALGKGKTVLFVAEKMAALEVVKRRLDKVGLGDACLELHSQKANKKAFLQELQRTLQLGEPKLENQDHNLRALQEERDYLDRYCKAVNNNIANIGITPYQAYGLFLQSVKKSNGIPLPKLDGKQLASWKETDFLYKLELVARYQTLLGDMGIPTCHPFWGSRRRVYLPGDQEVLQQACSAAYTAVTNLRIQFEQLAKHLSQPIPISRAEALALHHVATAAMNAPTLNGTEAKAEEWQTNLSVIISTLESAIKGNNLKAHFDAYLTSEALRQEWTSVRQALATHGHKWSRFISGEYRRARKSLRDFCKGDLPESVDEQIQMLDAVMEVQRLQPLYDKNKPLLQRVFGQRWHDAQWEELLKIAKWFEQLSQVNLTKDLMAILLDYLASAPDFKFLRDAAINGQDCLQKHQKTVEYVIQQAELDQQKRFSTQLIDLPFIEQEQILQEWSAKVELLQQMVKYNELADDLFVQDMREIIDVGLAWADAPQYLMSLVKKTRYEGIIEKAMREHSVLATFNSITHQHRIGRFRELDALLLKLNRTQLLHQHWQNLPKYAAGGLGILQEQFNRKRGHKSIRTLINEAGPVIQAIKPIFMMSPFSIANFLPPESIQFDLVIFDEASQVKPVDAFGAIVRGRQIVVVGDDKQLPPTSFFDRVVDGSGDDEDNIAADTESILGLFRAKSDPAQTKMLRWHYRSRHESLIAVSNYEFYDNRLIIFPSPDKKREQSGLIFHHLPTTTYVPGDGGGFNDEEAKIVAKAIINHARTDPHQTLLVATFNQKQRDVIENYLENLRKEDPTCEPFFNAHHEEAFVIKNLENVQGDERDVVFISVGYGRNSQNKLSMNFGPLNKEGGERRLNVLITRARTRCEVFTNLTSNDIDLTRTEVRGVKAFKRFLKYAEMSILDVPEPTGGGIESPFEQSVFDALTEAGYRIDTQVGTGGYRIDLAVIDEDQPGRYLLGIECDGATYHSAQSVRDRDRLRQEVLENMGWRIHRIWSTDWFRHPQRELQRIVDSIAQAKAHKLATIHEPASPVIQQSDSTSAVQRHTAQTTVTRPPIPKYQIATPKFQISSDNLHQITIDKVVDEIVRIVEIEGPLHIEELARRIASRVTKNVREKIDLAVSQAYRAKKINKSGDFLLNITPTQPIVRDRSGLVSPSNKIEFIYTGELESAIERVVDYAFGIKRPDIAKETLRLLGYTRATTEMKQRIEEVLNDMLVANKLFIEGEFVIKASLDR